MVAKEETVLLEISDGVAVVTLNRPDKMNALNTSLKKRFREVFESLASDDSVKVVVLTGKGRAFCAGADLSEVHRRDTFVRRRESMQDPPNIVREFPKPVIAFLNGYTLGGGLELALGCDIRIASEEAQLGFPEVIHGWLPAGGGGTQNLPRAVGMGRAMLMTLTGKRIQALQAQQYGLVEEVVSPDGAHEYVVGIAREIAQHRLATLVLIKSALRMSVQTDLQAGLHYERELSAIAYQLQGKEEAVEAFFSKRKPEFTD